MQGGGCQRDMHEACAGSPIGSATAVAGPASSDSIPEAGPHRLAGTYIARRNESASAPYDCRSGPSHLEISAGRDRPDHVGGSPARSVAGADNETNRRDVTPDVGDRYLLPNLEENIQ